MINVAVYIQGEQIDLFKDERIEINLSVKNVSDISKILSDFTQTFSVPANQTNNAVFTHWYDAAVDGTFNANVRVDAYLEVNSLPFRFGSVQLTEAKLKNFAPSSYSITFFSNAVNLSDLFGDEELSALDLSEFDHVYNDDVIQAMYSDYLSGDMYYPLINAVNEMSIGTTGDRDLIDPANEISYREFKPALRLLKIIEAIETRYGVTFTRDFFDRSVFYNLFMWLHRDAGYMKAFGNVVTIDVTGAGTIAAAGGVADTTNDTITFNTQGAGVIRRAGGSITPDAGFETIPYKIIIENNGTEVYNQERVGASSWVYTPPIFTNGTNVVKAKIAASASFDFDSTFGIVQWDYTDGSSASGAVTTPAQSITAEIVISEQMPQMKVKDFFISIVNAFNLVIVPVTATEFYVDTLDNWYSKGKAYNITSLVDVKDVTVKRPAVKKRIDFKYEKAGAILGEKYLADYSVGYGDLKAVYEISGEDLKIESKFENLLFERLPNETTNDLTDIQAGYSIDKQLAPYKGSPYIFYRNGFTDITDELIIQPSGSLNRIWHTATEDNLLPDQVTSSLNFGADISSYFYTSIERSLYFNFWKTYIEDLYDSKTRIYTIKCKLPVQILYRLKLNDRLVFRDNKYKISSAKIDLATGQAEIEMFTDLSAPLDSAANVLPLTVDSTEYTVDTEQITVDMISVYDPVTSYTVNGVSTDQYIATAAEEHFEVRISANTNWTATKIDDGDGVGWFTVNKVTGDKSDYVRVSLNENTGAFRSATLRFTIASTNYDITINQSI